MAKQNNTTDLSYYEATIVCKNCKQQIDVLIPTGKTVKEYEKKAKCDICKCQLKSK